MPASASALLFVVALAAGQSAAPVYNIRLVTDNTPDLTDIDRYLQSITSQHETRQEKAIAIWAWSQKLRKQASNPREAGHDIFDPITLFNSYGHCNCGVISGVNNALWQRMGWKTHYVQLGDHTVSETSWDDGKTWHMFDTSTSYYCFNDDGGVASVKEIAENPRFYLENFRSGVATNPAKSPDDHQAWRGASDWPAQYKRTLANGYDSYRSPNSISDAALHAQWGRRYVLNLRPDESYTRHFERLDKDEPSPRFYRPLNNGKDVEKQHGHQGIRGNGVWRYAPDLRHPAAQTLVYDSVGVKWGDPHEGYAVRPADPAEPGTVVFRVSAANVVTSAELTLAASRGSEGDAVEIEVSTDAGITWSVAGTLDRTGEAIKSGIDLMSLVAGSTEYLVRVRLRGGGAGLESLSLDTLTQLNRAGLPRLVRGSNRVQLTLGAQEEIIQFQPPVVAGRHRATVAEEVSIDVEEKPGFYKPVLRPATNGAEAHVTWKLETPGPITSVNYGGTVCVKSDRDSVTLAHSWDGEQFTETFKKDDDSVPFDLMVNRDVTDVPAGARTAYFRYAFSTERNAASYTGPGIQMARMTVAHEPRVKGFTPILVTYCWTEHHKHGDVERRHTEPVGSPAHEYVINVGGFRYPTMRWVRLELRESAVGADGYSDGRDAGPGEARPLYMNRWGTNIALGRPYQLSGSQDHNNPDSGGDLTDGVVAPPDEYVSEKFMPTNVMFQKDAVAVATIDLGEPRPLAGVRVHAGQEPGFRLAFPETITVELSTDGKHFKEAARTSHDQVFDPPADFIPWEHDDSPKYADLPAGGRLAYPYHMVFGEPITGRYVRVTCRAQEGWGLLISEIQSFDSVEVDTDIPPPVTLPPLSRMSE